MASSSAALSAPAPARAAVAPAPALDRRVAAAQQGDVAAFEQLYREHVGRIHALCLRMAPDLADPEGLTQEVFVRAWEKLPTFRGDAAFGTWLHRIGVNTVLNQLRALSRRAHGQPRADASTLERVAETPQAGGVDLERAIERLPERARTVFVLHDVEGYRHAEIAELMDLAPGTSKSQLHRARKLLREALRS
jgi:RNA polymerase sigma-70 factor (ECF subfamily)